MFIIKVYAASNNKWLNPYFCTRHLKKLIMITNTTFKSSFSISNSLVVYGSNLSSNVGYPRYNKLISSQINLPPHLKGVVIGLILSDGWISFSSVESKNARLGFKQSFPLHYEYFWYVFNLLSHYNKSLPYISSSVKNGVRSNGLVMQTRALPIFTELRSLFYINNIKSIPDFEIIFDLLTPQALAHWIAGDGTLHNKSVILCTDSYSIRDVVKLINVLSIKYGLECTLPMHKKVSPRIRIKVKSMPRLISIVADHMPNSMQYKLGI